MAPDIVDRALTPKRESKFVEFKEGFDCDSRGEWCEVIKDLVAIANSGGGIIVFGLGNTGEPVDTDLTKIAALDPADVSNKVRAYTGSSDFDFSIVDLVKHDKPLVAFIVHRDLLADPTTCRALLSKACITVFGGDKEHRATARSLDSLAYGESIIRRGQNIYELLRALIADRLPGDELSTSPD